MPSVGSHLMLVMYSSRFSSMVMGRMTRRVKVLDWPLLNMASTLVSMGRNSSMMVLM